MKSMPGWVKLVEVGPRDGLQNEPQQVPPGDMAGLLEAGRFICGALGREPASKVAAALKESK